jgi:hypothetical protein
MVYAEGKWVEVVRWWRSTQPKERLPSIVKKKRLRERNKGVDHRRKTTTHAKFMRYGIPPARLASPKLMPPHQKERNLSTAEGRFHPPSQHPPVLFPDPRTWSS